MGDPAHSDALLENLDRVIEHPEANGGLSVFRDVTL